MADNQQTQLELSHTNLPKAFIFGIGASFCLSVMGLFVKLVSPSASTNITIFSRFLISFIYIAIILGVRSLNGRHFSLKPQRFSLHLLRAFFGLLGMSLLYYSLRFIPLMDANLLTMTSPLFIPIITLILLGIRTRVSVLIAILVGFVGTALVLKPSHGIIDLHALYALGAGLASAFAIFMIREMGKRDHPQTMMFYYFLLTMLLSGTSLLFHCEMQWNQHTLLLLLGVGLSGTIYQECLIRGSCHAPASIMSTLLYLSVVFSTLFDWLIWGLIPDIYNQIGLILIVMSSYTIVTRRQA